MMEKSLYLGLSYLFGAVHFSPAVVRKFDENYTSEIIQKTLTKLGFDYEVKKKNFSIMYICYDDKKITAVFSDSLVEVRTVKYDFAKGLLER